MSYNFSNAITIFKDTVTKQYWDVNGRTSRSDFWHYQSIAFLLSLIIGFVAGFIGGMAPAIAGILVLVSNLFSLVLLAPNIGIAVRRMHDIDKAWWFMLIPFYNIYLACQPGTKGPNQYGPDPLGAAAVETFS